MQNEYIEVAELVVSSQAGNRAAYGKLCERFHEALKAIALRVMPNDAEDVVADVFCRFLEKINTIREPMAFTAMIQRSTHNTATMRKNKHLPVTNYSGKNDRSMFDELVASPDEVEDQSEVIDPKEAAAELLSGLGDNDRAILTAHYLHGKKLREIAVEWNLPLGTIKRRISYARVRAAELAAA